MKLLISGSHGLAGKALVKSLEAQGHAHSISHRGGGKIGNGKRWMSWTALHDVVGAIE